MKNRLGQVFNSVAGAPVEITMNGKVFAYLLSADDYWKLTGGSKLDDQQKHDVLIDLMNGEISAAAAMKALCVTNRNELNKMSVELGIGIRDQLLDEKNEKRNAFFCRCCQWQGACFRCHAVPESGGSMSWSRKI